MFYKNISYSTKTFYGVTFKPGEIKEVAGDVNSPWMIEVEAPKAPVTPTEVQKPQQKPSPDKPKKETPKAADAKQEAKDAEKEEPSKANTVNNFIKEEEIHGSDNNK